MGAISSTLGRRNGGLETVDVTTHNAYKYPPKYGNYFGSHFIMGGERFDMSQPESYLFGESTDLNFLGSKPVPFPYPPFNGSEPTKTLKSLVNIRKDTLRLVSIPEVEKLKLEGQDDSLSNKYNIEFTFDCDVKCAIKIMVFCTEDLVNGQIVYQTREPSLTSETFQYKRGTCHVFQQSSYIINPSLFPDAQWQFSPDKDEIPVVIQCLAEDDDNYPHYHMTFAVIERSSLDSCYFIKPLKQKQFVHGLCYLLQEIYGIENKNTEKVKEEDGDDDEMEDSGAECVICMSDMRDTLILPCRHLCLCSTCAESLRYQASSCPICRSPFRALLHIRAMRKKPIVAIQQGDQTTDDAPVSQEGVPAGFEAVSLIEALNGPCGLPLPNTMEGIHVPPPNRYSHPEIETGSKHRLKKKHNTYVETVKEMMMSEDNKKIPEVKDVELTDSCGKTEALNTIAEPYKSPSQKLRSKSVRLCKSDSRDDKSVPQLLSPEQEQQDSLHVVNEVNLTPKKTCLSIRKVGGGLDELTAKYPPLVVSSENLADDEREDTSEGEPEPEPDYELDDNSLAEEIIDSVASGADLTEMLSESNFVSPPDYASVMCDEDTTGDTDADTDDCSSGAVRLHLSSSPPSTDSASSKHSSHVLLPQEKNNVTH